MFKICKFANYQLGTFSNQEELIKYKIVNQIFYHKNVNLCMLRAAFGVYNPIKPLIASILNCITGSDFVGFP